MSTTCRLLAALAALLVLTAACVPYTPSANGPGAPPAPTLPSPASTASAPAAAPTALKFCASASPLLVLPAYALDRGIFLKYGLDVQLDEIGSGTDSSTALVAGTDAVCQVAGSSIVNAALAGHDLVLIGGIVNQQLYSLVVQSGIQSASDLKGKSVAVNRAGGASDIVMRQALQLLGLVPDRDVTILQMGAQGDRLKAMQSRQIAGSLFSVPDTSKARALGFHILVDVSQLNSPYQHTAIATSRKFLASDRPRLVALMQALSDATARMKQDRQGTIAVMAKELLLDPIKDAAYLDEAYDVLIQKYIPQKLYPNRDGVQELIAQARLENPSALDLKADDLLDSSIVSELDTGGFIQSLYR